MAEIKQFPNSVMLTCRDVGRSLAFYRDVMGFRVEESFPDERQPMWANLVKDRQSIMIGGSKDPDSPECAGQYPADHLAWWKGRHAAWQGNDPGVGVFIYIAVDDIDAYHAQVVKRGGKPATKPHSEFYGIRDFAIADPDGYQLMCYTAIRMSECQSCGMPMADAEPGQMYCRYCTDERGQLKPYEQVLEGTVQGYFMGMKRMERGPAERAAREHLARMPAWAARATQKA